MAEKWILRNGSKAGGFTYSAPDGRPVKSRKELERIDLLRIPPAWRDVHIAANPRAAIQVWGFDARGRKQYRYHARAVQKGELRKFYRVAQMGRDLPRLRRKFLKDLKRQDYSRERVCAGIVLIIGEAFIRVGSEKYEKENNTFGITTLRTSHVSVEGDVVEFNYVGKRSIHHRQVVKNRGIARFVESLLGTPGPRLFRYQNDSEWTDADARDVNEYIGSVASFPYTAKDFRTWGGSLRAATVLAEIGTGRNENARKKDVTMSVRIVASELGNTPAICRKSYVHPVILTRYLRSGAKIGLSARHRGVRTSPYGHTAEEKALIAFLNKHFPDRRKERRDG
ncbi:MAG: hypothetical protein Q7S20_13550 [Gemmatimonadaceae bacterium]|nr:hypothetical protein [Gemmatimonadaceae bacterium]